MALHSPIDPAFGKADLSNCEREQIHLAGSIQPHGALIVVEEPALRVVQTSVNARDFLGIDEPLLGRRLDELPGNAAKCIQPHLKHTLQEIPRAVRCRLGSCGADLDGLIHRLPQGGLVIELERAGPALDLSSEIDDALRAIRSAASLKELGDEAARLFHQIAGYDRAMVYRFDDNGHGEVFSEKRAPALDSFLGQRYPASDIPQIARRLYERNRVRVLGDVSGARIPLEPRFSPITGEDLDMSLCFLRAMSPIHIQYLQNMGVAATLVASLVVDGRLWGLVACHHYSPRFVHYEVRAVCELLAESVATRIAALESFVHAQAELSVRRLEQRMVEVISRDGDWRSALFDDTPSLLQPLNAGGAALLFEGDVISTGEVPGTQDLRRIGTWLDERKAGPVFATASLGRDEPAFEPIAGVASGLVAAPVASTPGEYLLWFRPARSRTVTWGGNPFEPFEVGDDPNELSPRRSFAQWHQQVEGTSEPWVPADLTAAKLIGQTIADVVLQFRSVRVLIAQDQLDNLRRQVQRSEHPVLIADTGGRILLNNEAFEGLLETAHPHLHWITDLASVFSDPAEVRGMFATLLEQRRACRGEVRLRTASGETRCLLLRGDPVVAPPSRLLGFVILVTDLTERRAADAARRRFQEVLVAPHRRGMLESQDEPTYQHLMSSVLGNAQLAALEISDGADTSRVPRMLDSVRVSLDRTAELLEHLVSHASRAAKPRH